ncbi:unnamed protein product [Strongylus vulgaris]|uniref:Uncharacterized protein n=1 Tax=Strongylus vulgaris TaxID=40348 RepID=A0A3P7K391_STRVU|nr:unnamed protein product [Strongylus vulgaris]
MERLIRQPSTMENLILNKTNLEGIEEDFLDPQIDIEDYFD